MGVFYDPAPSQPGECLYQGDAESLDFPNDGGGSCYMPLPENIDFCCLALDGPRLEVEGTNTLIQGLTVSNSPAPIELDGTWEHWLGTLQTDSFKGSSLVILAQEHSSYAGSSETVRLSIERRVRLFHYALILLGCGYNSGVMMVGGNTSNGHLHIGPISPGLTPCRHPQYRKHKLISKSHLKRAAAMLVSLEHVYDHVPGADYRRIRKGFNSWVQAVENTDPAQGLHSFVRAAEAIIRPTTTTWTDRKVTKTFVNRGQTFTGKSKKNERLLRQLYNLRSCIEHVKNILPVVHKPRGVSRDEAFAFRALQAEIFASAIYSRIFTNDALREQLRTERRVEGFWRRSDANRGSLWGKSIDLSATGRREFSSMRPLDIL